MQEILSFIQQHWMLSLAFVFVLLGVMMLEFINQKRNAVKATPVQVTRLINDSKVSVIDIRNDAQFKEGHIIGSVSIPAVEINDSSKKIQKLKTRSIIMVCANGTDSARVAQPLLKQGFDVRVLAGGIQAWRKAEMPLVKE